MIDTGSLALCVSPLPGPVAVTVARCSLSDKLAYDVRRAPTRLPGAAGEKLPAPVAPKRLRAVTGVLVAWAASHAVDLGEVADFLLIVGGINFLGKAAVDAGTHLCIFAPGVLQAKSGVELDRAACHLARAVFIVGSPWIALTNAQPLGMNARAWSSMTKAAEYWH